MESRPTLCQKLTYSIQHFSNDKEKFYVHVGFNLTRSSIFPINYLHVPSGRVGKALQNLCIRTGPLNDAGSNPVVDFFTFLFSFELDMPFLINLKINIFVVILK